jgi:hypothetical protein
MKAAYMFFLHQFPISHTQLIELPLHSLGAHRMNRADFPGGSKP